jgi:hypothetical protein
MREYPSQRRCPAELRERAVRVAQELIAEQGGQRFGVVQRVTEPRPAGRSRGYAALSASVVV